MRLGVQWCHFVLFLFVHPSVNDERMSFFFVSHYRVSELSPDKSVSSEFAAVNHKLQIDVFKIFFLDH